MIPMITMIHQKCNSGLIFTIVKKYKWNKVVERQSRRHTLTMYLIAIVKQGTLHPLVNPRPVFLSGAKERLDKEGPFLKEGSVPMTRFQNSLIVCNVLFRRLPVAVHQSMALSTNAQTVEIAFIS
jgi:hypothetical protein